MKLYLFVLSLFFCSITYAQTNLTGKVVDENNQPIPGANIKIVGESIGSATDFDGKFLLSTTKTPPFSVEVSSIGFATKKVEVTRNNQVLNVTLAEEETRLNEIVISASRTPERVLESPVTIERMSLQEIKNTTSPSFYEGLENLKEVHFNTSSLNFKSINTRGFATVANTRFMQLVDGMDNSSPALNFVLGNLIGVSELDVQSVELLPGASSALYGANAFNGILFMNSKSPFDHEGISTYTRNGITTHEVAGQNDYWDFGIRAAKTFTKHFAAKANFTYLRATEWIAADERNVVNANVMTNPNAVGHAANVNYDGLNTYGDEVTTNIRGVGQSLANLGVIPAGAVNLLPNQNVSRTGYREQDLNDNSIENTKFDVSLHFKPFVDSETAFWNTLEVIGQHKVGLGNTVYQGANRYRLENFYMQQTKLEFKNDRFFFRGYVTSEDAGDSYDMRFAGWNVNRAWKSDSQWFGQYAGAFIQGTLAGLTAEQAHAAARGTADTGRFLPGSQEFNNALNTVIQNPDLREGAKFIDRSKVYHSDLNYNLKDVVKFAEIQVGGSARRYELNSQGTIFTDTDGPINYDEFGIYTQMQKKFLDDKLKFTGSVRYDKSQNFEGQVSPRVSLVYTTGEKRNHNFRASFQTGFRNPTTQDQYIGLDLGPFALIGSAPDNLDRFVETLPISSAGQNIPGAGIPSTVTFTGNNAYNTPVYSVPSVAAFAQTGNPALLEVLNVNLVKPEQVNAMEIGYKSVLENGLSIDINSYYNIYNDFMSTSRIITPYYGTVGTDFTDPQVQLSLQAIANGDRRVYQVYTNTSETVTSFGFGVGLSKKIFGNFELGANYNHAQFDFDQSKDPAFIAGFNTPKHRIKGSFGNNDLFKNFGFNFNARWSSEYLWQSSFADGMIPEVTVFDAQINYRLPKLKSVIKLSAANLLGNDYLQVIGAGRIGQQFLASLTINP